MSYRDINSDIRITEVHSYSDRKLFASLPSVLYKKNETFSPQLLFDELRFQNPQKNPFLKRNIHCFFLAWKNAKPAGRISVHLDEEYENKYGKGTGFFGCFDAAKDKAVLEALLYEAEKWLLRRGKYKVQGPYYFNINQICGLQINGYEESPTVKTGYSPPWISSYLKLAGYQKAKDLLCYTHKTSESREWLERARKARKKWKDTSRLKIHSLKKSEYPAHIDAMRRLYNESYSDNWGSVPISYEEAEYINRLMKPLLFKGWTKLAYIDGKLVGMLSLIPNLDEKILNMNGKLFPFNFLELLYSLKFTHFKKARIPVICVAPRYKNTLTGGAIVTSLMAGTLKTAIRSKVKEIEISWMLEDNNNILNFVKKLPATPVRTYRLYEKNLK